MSKDWSLEPPEDDLYPAGRPVDGRDHPNCPSCGQVECGNHKTRQEMQLELYEHLEKIKRAHKGLLHDVDQENSKKFHKFVLDELEKLHEQIQKLAQTTK